MALLKLYRGAAAPAAEVGKIWFDKTENVIKVCTAAPEGAEATWESYGLSKTDLAALVDRVAALEVGVKTINEVTLPALEDALEKYADDAVAVETGRATGEEARIEGLVNTEKGRAEGVEAGLETRLAAVEADYLKAADKTELSDAIASEKTRAEGKEAELLAAIEAEAATARAAEKGLADRLGVIEGEAEGSIKKALADAKAYTDAAKAAIEGTLADDDAKTLEAINDELDTLAARGYKVAEVTEGLPANIERRYQLVDQTGAVIEGSVNIDVEKESALKNVELVDADADGVAGNYLKWTYVLADGTEKVQYLNVSDLLVEAEFKNGLEVSVAGEVSVKVDAASESFLTVGEAGVKLSGVADAIATAVAAEAEIARAAEKANADAIAAEVARATAAEEAIAADLATLDAEVQEHEVVVSAALNDLNARVDGHATRLDELEAGLGAVEHNTVSDGDTTDFVEVSETTDGSHKNYAVSATVVKGANGGDAGLATDAYVREQITAAALVWEKGSF